MPHMKHMPPDWVLDTWWIRCTSLLYRDMCWFVVPLRVRMKGHVTTWEGLSLLGGQPLGSRVPGSEAYYFLFDMREWCGEGPYIVE